MPARVVGCLAILLALAAAPAAAQPAGGFTPLQQISDRSPFDDCGVVVPPPFQQEDFRPQDTAGEPHLAVNPRNPQNIVSVWMQDFTEAHIVAVTTDGGKRWRRVVPPGLSDCTGGPKGFSPGDPFLAFGRDGTLYLSSMLVVFPAGSTTPRTAVVVSRSDDGGLTWSDPVEVEPANAYNDHPDIAVDARDPRRVYIAWTKNGEPLGGRPEGAFFSRSEDGGRTWTAPREVHRTGRPLHSQTFALLETTGDGDLVWGFRERNEQGVAPGVPDGQSHFVTIASRDGGETWSDPTTIVTTGYTADPEDEHGREAEGGSYHLLGGRSRVHFVAPHLTEEGTRILYASSADGRSWSDPVAVRNAPAGVLFPQVAEAGDRRLAIAYYDDRNDVEGDAPWTFDAWVAHSGDAGATWSDGGHLGGPADLRQAWEDARGNPSGDGPYWLGDYVGFAGLRRGFAAALPLSPPTAPFGKSQVFFTRSRVPVRRLTVRVRPRVATAGSPTTFHVSVRTARGRAVRGAIVRLAGRRDRTGRRGRATIRVTPGHRGALRVTARAPGHRPGLARVRIR